jgi:hypothetical protein
MRVLLSIIDACAHDVNEKAMPTWKLDTRTAVQRIATAHTKLGGRYRSEA